MSSVDTQLHAALARALHGVPHHELRRRVDALSARYRNEQINDTTPGMSDDLDALAYAVVRMPATYHAIHAALAAVARHVDAPINTHLDLGGGTGAAAWAAAAHWPGLRTEIVERQPAAIHLGKTIAAGNKWRWTTGDLRKWSPGGSTDLLTIAYVLNELTDDARRALVDAAVRCAQTVVVVEPGTPRGHRHILEARDQLLAHGFRIAAPCPHEAPCPATWCHFATRLPRTELRRLLKNGTRNFEDEKFMYVVATHSPIRTAPARVIARPTTPKNRVVLDLCTAAGAAERIVVPKSSELYRAARRTSWGDAW
ncbi:small ribosomal subunit Rsm22 family protein [Kribbella jejuensis]|uniref:Ribosomal protein RSM22 (Predicted rRNA methylase) n=1 Tax=Kribbella jejuensis TaxID=236068 RepID=A0A542DTN7_9ACTN|nr:small ribosomal subunit Rsm22 family protein [Kribbella jejuensis]TQJ06457.1 ribosomal protein RSM22 (predicted rRNA methylase) [Kribbella jejuensis]